jgi:hypothetical protein
MMRSIALSCVTRFCLAVALVIVGASQHGAAQATIVEFDAPGSTFTIPDSINSTGSIVGYYIDSQMSSHGFLRDSTGNITTIDAPGAAHEASVGTFPIAINDSAEIAGYYTPLSNPSSYLGFIRDSAGNFSSFGVPGSVTTEVLAFNNAGQTAGCQTVASSCGASPDQGFVRGPSGGTFAFSPEGAITVDPSGMNASGSVTGSYADSKNSIHGFILSPGDKITEFSLPGFVGSGVGTFPTGINDGGVVAGWFQDEVLRSRGFLRAANGKVTVFDAPGSETYTYTQTINFGGSVAGFYSGSLSVAYRGFVRDPLGNFTTFAAPGAGHAPGLGTAALAINRNGVVAGFYYDANTMAHGYLRTP